MKKVLVALFVVGLLSACGSRGDTASRSSPGPSISPSPTTEVSPTLVPRPTPPAGFVTTPVSGGSVADSTVSTIRVGQREGYDRFVIEFGGGVPSYTVTPQTNPTFTRSPKGDQVTLDGTGGVLITVHSVTNWNAYSGPTSFQPGYPYLREAVQVENFEGNQQWALGVEGNVCVRVTTLASPNRLVVDVVGI